LDTFEAYQPETDITVWPFRDRQM